MATYFFETITDCQAQAYQGASDLIFSREHWFNETPYTPPRLRDRSRPPLKAAKFKLKRRIKL